MKCNYLISTFAISCILGAPTYDRPFNHNVKSLLRALSGDNNNQQASQPPAQSGQHTEENKGTANNANLNTDDKNQKPEGTKKDDKALFLEQAIQAAETVLRFAADSTKGKSHKGAQNPHTSHDAKPNKYNVKLHGDYYDEGVMVSKNPPSIKHREFDQNEDEDEDDDGDDDDDDDDEDEDGDEDEDEDGGDENEEDDENGDDENGDDEDGDYEDEDDDGNDDGDEDDDYDDYDEYSIVSNNPPSFRREDYDESYNSGAVSVNLPSSRNKNHHQDVEDDWSMTKQDEITASGYGKKVWV